MRLASLLLLVLATVASCGSPPRPNILLIVIDTLRADRLGCYGNDRGLTPFLDSLAERGFVMHRAYAQSSWTSPSIASLFTSRFQSQHRVVRIGAALYPHETTLAEVLRDHGYRTGGLSANGVLQGSPDKFFNGARRPGGGFGQGFGYYEAKVPRKVEGIRARALWETARADEINREALDWIDQRTDGGERPTFLYLHYMEPHIPYAPEESFLRHTFAGREIPPMRRVNGVVYRGNNFKVKDSMLRDVESVYDAEVMSIDAALRSLFAELEERGFLDQSIVIITSDHGEEFKDHGLIGHGKTLYDELIRVPLLILLPDHSQRVDVWDLVSLVDVAPTLTEWLQIEPPDSFMGRSFRSDLLGAASWWRGWLAGVQGWFADTPRLAYSELLHQDHRKRLTPHERALVLGFNKLIVGVGGESELYDIRRDPREKDDEGVTGKAREILFETLAAMQRQVSDSTFETDTGPLDPATEEILRALGYRDS